MEKITGAQIKAIATMCSKANISKETKSVMVEGFSSGRCSSSRDLFVDEATDLIKHLVRLQPTDERLNKMRGKIFYYAHEMGWVKQNREGKKVVDGKRLDEWMLKFSYKKKKLNYYAYAELPKLVSQIEAVYKHFLKSI